VAKSKTQMTPMNSSRFYKSLLSNHLFLLLISLVINTNALASKVILPGDLSDHDYDIGAILTVEDADASDNINHDPELISVSSNPEIRINPVSLDFVEPEPTQDSNQATTLNATSTPQFTKDTLPRLTAKIRHRGKANLIVGLNMITQAEGKLTAMQAQQQHQDIRTRGNQLASGLKGLNAQIRRQFEFVPYMALAADQATLDYLIQSPLVASISEDAISKPQMASSNPVIGSPVAWAEGFDGSGWAVAVLDTGVDNTHSWFTTPANKVVSEACYSSSAVDEIESLCPGGASGSTAVNSAMNCDLTINGCDHGTHVAGTVAGNDEAGPNFGVARGADIIAMQVFSKFLTEDECGAGNAPCVASFSSDQIAAMERVLVLADSMNIAAVNMSLGGGQYFSQESCDADNTALKAAINNLRSVGIATVTAAGNNGWKDSILAPGCISMAISVSATTDSDDIPWFSNIYPWIHLLAPGVNINSSLPGDRIGSKQGTSMATPHVAGAWAIMKQLRPAAGVGDILATLQNTATPVSDMRGEGVEVDMPRINIGFAIGENRETFEIFNDGPATLSITSIAPQADSAWISWSPQAPFTVTAGESQIVGVTVDYSLAPPGTSQSRLLVNSNDPDESPYPNGVFIKVTALAREPEFSSTPEPGATLDFGGIAIESSSDASVIGVDNTGTASLVLSCNLTGTGADQFRLLACPGPVPATGSTGIFVSCEPASIGLKQATLNVTSNDTDEPEASYFLTCTGFEPSSVDVFFYNGFEDDPIVNLSPDLTVIDPGTSDSELDPGQAFTINATASNQGDGPSTASTLRFYLSADDVITTVDTALGEDAVPALLPGSISVQNLPITAPAETGTYWVGACIDAVAGEAETGNQCSTGVQIIVAATLVDSDGDRLPDSAETNTGIYVDQNNTGTDPNNADTDGDRIKDGDEVLGTLGGLDLPAMGVSPLRKDLLLEYDWFDDGLDCDTHSHRPTTATIASASAAFANSPAANPDTTSGVTLINDYGQGGAFTGGNLINDENGVIDGGVGGAEFRDHKAANFASNRIGYFHYVLLPHQYGTTSLSSGQAELPGDDLIVSLYCANSDRNVAHTIMHEVGHNLALGHGGNSSCNYKPNYNSVMNYNYQFRGIDNDCTPPGDGVLSYSTGNRIDLDENDLDENNGTCGPGSHWDWNKNSTIEISVTLDINEYDDEVAHCGGGLTTLRDHDDWSRLYFGGLGDPAGVMEVPQEIITEQPVPTEFFHNND